MNKIKSLFLPYQNRTVNKRIMRKFFISFLLITFGLIVHAQDVNFEFQNTNLPVDERVDILVSQMYTE